MEHFDLKTAKFCTFLGWLTKIVCNHSSMFSNKLYLQEFFNIIHHTTYVLKQYYLGYQDSGLNSLRSFLFTSFIMPTCVYYYLYLKFPSFFYKSSDRYFAV